jgi:hypothetical protein
MADQQEDFDEGFHHGYVSGYSGLTPSYFRGLYNAHHFDTFGRHRSGCGGCGNGAVVPGAFARLPGEGKYHFINRAYGGSVDPFALQFPLAYGSYPGQFSTPNYLGYY